MHTHSPLTRAPRIQRQRAASRRHRDPKPALTAIRVFFAYGEVPAARHAMAQVAAMLRSTHSGQQLQPMLWRFDQLNERHWREMALRDATEAAAVVIALSDETPLNSAVDTWLALLAARHRGVDVNVLATWNEELWSISLQQTTEVRKKGATLKAQTNGHSPTLVRLPLKKIAVRAA